MKITEFKEGDIVTRNERAKVSYSDVGDGSYEGDRMIFISYDPASNLIFLARDEYSDGKHWGLIDLQGKEWADGWCYFPETMLIKAKKFLKEKILFKPPTNN